MNWFFDQCEYTNMNTLDIGENSEIEWFIISVNILKFRKVEFLKERFWNNFALENFLISVSMWMLMQVELKCKWF